jgi:hypothetical protein
MGYLDEGAWDNMGSGGRESGWDWQPTLPTITSSRAPALLLFYAPFLRLCGSPALLPHISHHRLGQHRRHVAVRQRRRQRWHVVELHDTRRDGGVDRWPDVAGARAGAASSTACTQLIEQTGGGGKGRKVLDVSRWKSGHLPMQGGAARLARAPLRAAAPSLGSKGGSKARAPPPTRA